MQRLSSLYKKLIKYCIAAILIAIPLYPKFPFIRIPGTFVSIRLEDLILVFAGLLLSLKIIPNFRRFLGDQLNQTVMLFIVVALVSLLSSILITKTVVPHIGLFHWLRRIEYFLPLFFGVIAIRENPRDINFYFKIILIVIFIAFLYGLGQRYLKWPIVITQNEEYSQGVALRWMPGSHINSTFAGHYDLSTFLVLVLPIMICGLFLSKKKKSRIILISAILCGLWLLVNSASRISLISYMGAVTLSLLLIKKYKQILFVIILSIVFVGFSSNLLTRYVRIIEVTVNKIKKIETLNFDINIRVGRVFADNNDVQFKIKRKVPTPTPIPKLEDRSTNIRLNVEWPRAIRAFLKNPLLGTGYSSITLATDNDYLRLLGEVGLLGFISFLLLFINIIKIFFSKLPLNRFKDIKLAFIVGVLGAIPGVFLNAVFIDVFEASKFSIIFWLLIGMSIGTIKYDTYEHKN